MIPGLPVGTPVTPDVTEVLGIYGNCEAPEVSGIEPGPGVTDVTATPPGSPDGEAALRAWMPSAARPGLDTLPVEMSCPAVLATDAAIVRYVGNADAAEGAR